LRILPRIWHLAVFSLAFIVCITGCRPENNGSKEKAQEFRNRYHAFLVGYASRLAEHVAKRQTKKVKGVLQGMYEDMTGPGGQPPPSIAVLDNHGVAVASQAQTALTGAQNYGNYHVVSRVLQKRKILQSSLYLQNGTRIYVICAPILRREKVVGALIIGFDSNQLKISGITEAEFMSLDFTSPARLSP